MLIFYHQISDLFRISIFIMKVSEVKCQENSEISCFIVVAKPS